MFDADSRLLYVGITRDFGHRMKHHAAHKEWFGEVASLTLQHFADRGSVLAAEAATIAAEKPLHNVIRYEDLKLRAFRCPDADWKAAVAVAAGRGESFSEELRLMVAEYASR